MNFKRALAFALLSLMAILAGCATKHTVGFPQHSPYGGPRTHPETLVIVVPDDLGEEYFDQMEGYSYAPMRMRIMYGEAVRTEAVARFGKMFDRVALVDQSAFDELDDTEAGAVAAVAAVAEAEEEESDPMDFVPEFVRERTGFAIILSDINYAFDQGRSRYAMNVRFIDRAADETLFETRMRADGAAYIKKETANYVALEIQRSTVSALSTLFLEARNRVDKAIDARKAAP